MLKNGEKYVFATLAQKFKTLHLTLTMFEVTDFKIYRSKIIVIRMLNRLSTVNICREKGQGVQYRARTGAKHEDTRNDERHLKVRKEKKKKSRSGRREHKRFATAARSHMNQQASAEEDFSQANRPTVAGVRGRTMEARK